MNEAILVINNEEVRVLVEHLREIFDEFAKVVVEIAERVADAFRQCAKSICDGFQRGEDRPAEAQRIKAYLRRMASIPRRIYWYIAHRRKN